MTRVLFCATSYPRSSTDWQGIFIRHIADALADSDSIDLRIWSPEGPRHPRASSALTNSDARFLQRLTEAGGIAHLLRNSPQNGVLQGARLAWKLHQAYRRNARWADIFHINWLQCALGLFGLRKPALITVLGTDMALLRNGAVRIAIRSALRRQRVIVCPNAQWMVPELASAIGDLCKSVVYVPFGIDSRWFGLARMPARSPRIWITVLRVTRAKIGALFEWTRDLDPAEDQVHLFGPLQEQIDIPPWIRYHGAATPEELADEWFPSATGMISLSEHAEGRPQVMLDAMAAGLPIIASAITPHADLIAHEITGLIVKSREEFLQALNFLRDARAADMISERAARCVETQYGTWADCAARYADLYSSLLSEQ
jgi:glycosyltransferase involved in cell wall biosynthesis